MSASKKQMLESERAFLTALANEIRPFLASITYREAKACGIAGSQRYSIRRGEPINLSALTLHRVAMAMGLQASHLIEAAEAKVPRSSATVANSATTHPALQ